MQRSSPLTRTLATSTSKLSLPLLSINTNSPTANKWTHTRVLLLAICLLAITLPVVAILAWPSRGGQTYQIISNNALSNGHSEASSNSNGKVINGADETNKLAVVIPFIGVQTWKVLHSWNSAWLNNAPCPSSAGLNAPFEATLFLYFGQSLSGNDASELAGEYDSELLQETVLEHWNSLPHRHCFRGGLQFIENKRGALNHIEGSCAMFYDLFPTLEARGYGHMFWMEPDVTPVQPGWLNRMTEEIRDNGQCQRWWIKGSTSQCASWYGNIRDRHDYHLNGNALYCLGSSRFAEFRQRVVARYPGGTVIEAPNIGGCATGASYELGMDHAMYQYRLLPETFDYSKRIMSKFVYADFFANHCQEPYSGEDSVRDEPSTYLIHSGAGFRHASQITVAMLFESKFNRQASLAEKMKFSVRLDLGELNEEELMLAICVDMGWMEQEVCRTEHARHQNKLLAPMRSKVTSNSPQSHVPAVIPWKKEGTKADQVASALSTPWASRWPGQYYLWSSDLHAGPSMCNAEVYRQLGIVSHFEVDFGNCIYHGVCRDRLDVLRYDDWRGFSLDPCPHKVRNDFYSRYRDDSEMNRVDIITCSHPASNCELYLPLNKSLVVFATTRIEFGRNDPEIGWRKPIMASQNASVADLRWKEWVHNLQLIASSGRNLISANSLYDKYYIEHFTGIENVRVLPSLCKASEARLLTYSPFRSQFLIGPSRDNLDIGPCGNWSCKALQHPLYRELQAALAASNAETKYAGQKPLRVERIRSVYDNFELQDVLNHRAVIVFPYQSSTMLLTEMYRANVPMLAPSPRFLQEWDHKYDYLFERIYGHPTVAHRDLGSPLHPDPNSRDPEALAYWIKLFDIYQLPYITLFDSFTELSELLRTVDFKKIHEQMKIHNEQEEVRIVKEWKDAFDSLDLGHPGSHKLRSPKHSLNENMAAVFAGSSKPIWPVSTSQCLSFGPTRK